LLGIALLDQRILRGLLPLVPEHLFDLLEAQRRVLVAQPRQILILVGGKRCLHPLLWVAIVGRRRRVRRRRGGRRRVPVKLLERGVDGARGDDGFDGAIQVLRDRSDGIENDNARELLLAPLPLCVESCPLGLAVTRSLRQRNLGASLRAFRLEFGLFASQLLACLELFLAPLVGLALLLLGLAQLLLQLRIVVDCSSPSGPPPTPPHALRSLTPLRVLFRFRLGGLLL